MKVSEIVYESWFLVLIDLTFSFQSILFIYDQYFPILHQFTSCHANLFILQIEAFNG